MYIYKIKGIDTNAKNQGIYKYQTAYGIWENVPVWMYYSFCDHILLQRYNLTSCNMSCTGGLYNGRRGKREKEKRALILWILL